MRPLSFLAFALSIPLLFSCVKEETPLPAGGEVPAQVELGDDYGSTAFFDLSTSQVYTAKLNSWDLAFPTDLDSLAIRLNTGKLMLAWQGKAGTEFPVELPANTTFDWKTDAPHGWADSTALWSWHDTGKAPAAGRTFVVDRGSLFHKDSTSRFRYLQILGRNESSFEIRWAAWGSSDWTSQRIPLDLNYTHTYFTFDSTGRTLLVAPPRNQWDLHFTQYIFPFDELPPPGRWYLVRGALLNMSEGLKAAAVDSSNVYDLFPKYDDLKRGDEKLFIFRSDADVVGYDWKSFDLAGNYYLRERNYYLIRDREGVVYRLRFVDFYDDQGRKGYPSFVYDVL